jgi:SAM-dependent methyltransferase
VSRAQFSLWPHWVKNPNLLPLLSEIRSATQGCQTVLDVGCGICSPLRFLPDVHLAGIEGHAPSLEKARAVQTHDEFLLGDVRKVDEVFSGRRFDACIALDVIEHLPKEDGWKMLQSMEKLATKRVVIFTPNGFVPQHSRDGDLQEHLSGWTTEDLRSRGYQVRGMCGPKSFRGEYHVIKYHPRPLWAFLSLLIDSFHTRRNPETAAAILAIKRIS